MGQEYFMPWELSAYLFLLGFDEKCVRQYGAQKTKKLLLLYDRYGDYRNTHGYANRWQRELVEKFKQGLGTPAEIMSGTRICAPTYEQVEDWLRIYYNVDFFKSPRMHMGNKMYVCDPIGPYVPSTPMEPQNSPREALLQALDFVIRKLEPLPIGEEKDADEAEDLQEDVAEVND